MTIETIQTLDLLDAWRDIIERQEPHASIRIGDVEAAVAAHGAILTNRFVQRMYGWADNFYGLSLPNPEAREQLVSAFKQADFLGRLEQPEWYFRPIADMVIDYYELKPKRLFYAFDNFYLSKTREFYDSFRETKVILVGRTAANLKEVLVKRYDWRGIVAVIDCPSWNHLEQARIAMTRCNYDVALVSASIPGKILTAHAKVTGHVGIDFGSGADTCVQADADNQNAWEWKKHPVYGQWWKDKT